MKGLRYDTLRESEEKLGSSLLIIYSHTWWHFELQIILADLHLHLYSWISCFAVAPVLALARPGPDLDCLFASCSRIFNSADTLRMSTNSASHGINCFLGNFSSIFWCSFPQPSIQAIIIRLIHFESFYELDNHWLINYSFSFWSHPKKVPKFSKCKNKETKRQ